MNEKTRESLKEAYDYHANEREKNEIQAWKLEPRSNFLKIIKNEEKRNLLEIGAGHGRDSSFFMENGLKVIAVDLSPEMVKLCHQKGIEAYEHDFHTLSQLDKSFDAIWAMNCLLHVEKRNLPSVLKEIDQALNPSGLLFIGVYGGIDQEGIWEEDIYTPHRFFSFFTDEGIMEVVQNHFDLVQFNRVETGEKYHFQSIILRKRNI